MQIDVGQIGYTTGPHSFKVDWHKTALYALGIGAQINEIDYLYEARGPKVYPTFGVIPSFAPLFEVVAKVGATFANLVHGGQSIRIHRPIPPEGELSTTARLSGLYDLKRMVELVATTETRLGGELLFETTWSLILLEGGGFGGPRRPRPEKYEIPRDRPADFQMRQATLPEQAALYRLSGDPNPLHIDREFAEKLGFAQGPILHGLCTFGFVGRAVITGACQGQADRLSGLHAQFKKPVWPGEVIVTEGWNLDAQHVALSVRVEGRDEPVLGNAWAEITD